MGRIPKPNVRFAFAKKKKFPCQTVRVCLSYKGKRLFSTDEGNLWHGIDSAHFNSDGTLNNESNIPATDLIFYQYLSARLLWIADGVVSVAKEALKRGFWEAMTSSDFDKLLNMWYQCGDRPDPTMTYDNNGKPVSVLCEKERKPKTKEQKEWIQYYRKLYEGYWLAVTEGRCDNKMKEGVNDGSK